MLRDVHIVLDTNLLSFNLNLDLLTFALENLSFNTFDLEKVQGKSLGCIKSRGTHPLRVVHPRYRERPQRDERRGLPTSALVHQQFRHSVLSDKVIKYTLT